MRTYPDFVAARELDIYAENRREVYFSAIVPTVENLSRKARKGTYDDAKALKAWAGVAEAAARLYCREFATADAWHLVFNAATRRAAAEELRRCYAGNVKEAA